MTPMNLDSYEPKDCTEVYKIIHARHVTALMLHDDMADLFDFLGLRGFKRMHEYQYLVESTEHRALKRYYINHHGKLLPESKLTPVSVIPEAWTQHTRMDVTPSVRKQAVHTAMEQYLDWEHETKAIYSKMAAYLMDWQKVADFNKVNDLIKDVDMELKYLERLCIELRSVDYDPAYVGMLQDKYHERYRKKCEEIGVSIC